MEGKERGEGKKGGEERGEGNTRLTYIAKENAKDFFACGISRTRLPGSNLLFPEF